MGALPCHCERGRDEEVPGVCHRVERPARVHPGTMSSAFNPPKTMSQDDVRRVADVRRDVWTAGIGGGIAGVFLGSSGWLGLRHLGKLPKAIRTPNHYALITMGTGALLSFLSSLAAGKNSIQRIGDVFGRGAKVPFDDEDVRERVPYSAALHANRMDVEDTEARRSRRKAGLDARAPPKPKSAYEADDDKYGFAPKPPDR